MQNSHLPDYADLPDRIRKVARAIAVEQTKPPTPESEAALDLHFIEALVCVADGFALLIEKSLEN